MRCLPIMLMLSALVAGCSDACSNAIVNEVDGPAGAIKALMFQRDCGATTGFSTQISLLRAGEQLIGGGNAFRADDNHGIAFAGDWGGPWAEIKWIGPDQLLVRYAAKSRVFEQAKSVLGVKIIYQAVDR
jgi:hypothetical protein